MFSLSLLSILVALVFGQTSAPANQPFAIAISTERREVKAGAHVVLKVRLTNNSGQDVDMSGNVSDLTGLDPNYVFDVRDSKGNPVPKRTYKHPELAGGHPVMNRTVSPGKTLTEEQIVSRLYDMTHPGNYVIQVSRRVSDNTADGAVTSNKITVTVAAQGGPS